MKAGDTFHAQAPSSTKQHLYIVLTDPDANGKVVVANVTSQADGKDQSCVLQPNDHPFVTKESVINYADAILSDEALIITATRRRLFQTDVPVAPQVLGRVQQGALNSPHTERLIKETVRAALG